MKFRGIGCHLQPPYQLYTTSVQDDQSILHPHDQGFIYYCIFSLDYPLKAIDKWSGEWKLAQVNDHQIDQ